MAEEVEDNKPDNDAEPGKYQREGNNFFGRHVFNITQQIKCGLRPGRELHPRMAVLQTAVLATSPPGQNMLNFTINRELDLQGSGFIWFRLTFNNF